MEKEKKIKVIKTRASSQQNGNGNPNQKKMHNKAHNERKSIYITEYMKEVIKIKQGTTNFYCSLCPGNPSLLKRNIFRHIIESSQHKNSISKEKDIKGHDELTPKIVEAMTKNKAIYSKKVLQSKNQAHITYLRLLIFCQSQKFTIMQTSALTKFLKELMMNQEDPLIIGVTEREEISLIARSFGRCILEKLKQDLSHTPYSIMLDSSTMVRKNVTLLKVRYPKEYIDPSGIKRTIIENRTLGVKFLGHSSSAISMLNITKEKLFTLGSKVKDNLVGFVHDHAKNFSGKYNGLGTLLRNELQKFLFDVKDPCHSLSLTLQKSLTVLPNNILSFIEDIHNHFVSPQRKAYLNQLQLDENMKVLCPKNYIKTRWLSMGESLKRILEIWDSLSKYMAQKPSFGVSDQKYEDFVKLLESKSFKAKIQVLASIVNKLNQINIRFQDQTLEIQHIKLEIQRFIKFLCNLYMKNEFHPDFNQFDEQKWRLGKIMLLKK